MAAGGGWRLGLGVIRHPPRQLSIPYSAGIQGLKAAEGIDLEDLLPHLAVLHATAVPRIRLPTLAGGLAT